MCIVVNWGQHKSPACLPGAETEPCGIFVPFHQQLQRAVDAFTSCDCELPSVYMQDNRHQVPTDSCCFSLLPVVRIRKGEKERGEVQERGAGGGQRGEEDRTISTGKRRALVHSLFTVESCVAVGTLAHVAAAIVLFPALAAMETGRVCTGQQPVFTVGALETLGARAHVAGFEILEGKEGKRAERLFGVPKSSCFSAPVSNSPCIRLRSDRGCCHTPASPAHS